MYNIRLIGIVTTNLPLYNEYILMKKIKKRKVSESAFIAFGDHHVTSCYQHRLLGSRDRNYIK
jgi:phosphoglycerol transferase MdoB-like AlkP superfamily enzyme